MIMDVNMMYGNQEFSLARRKTMKTPKVPSADIDTRSKPAR
jgi:hypothetical protein